MSGRNGQELLSTWVPTEVAAAFRAQARLSDGGTAAALRRLVAQAIDTDAGAGGLHGARPPHEAIAPRSVGHGKQVGVRLKDEERAALAAAARAHGTSPANWIRSLALVHLTHRPQWNATELDALRDVFRELRSIVHRIDSMRQTLDAAGQCLPGEGDAMREAAQQVRWEMRRVVAVMSGNFDYWGLPDADRPTAAPGAMERARDQVRAAKAQRKQRPRRRPAWFTDGT